MYRTLYCNDISESHVGQRVQLAGWVDVIRDHGGVIFVDIRDYTGITQTVIHDEEMVKNVNRETVISVSGIVRKRDEDTVNTKIATGYVELVVDELTVLGKSKNMLPFDVRGSRLIKDELRLKYRYLDLRNPKNHENLLMRSRIIRHLRNKMESKDFLEMQTPILTASSPEGARDYLVPTVLPVSSISSTSKWLLLHRKKFSKSARTLSTIHSRHSQIRKSLRSLSAESHMPMQ